MKKNLFSIAILSVILITLLSSFTHPKAIKKTILADNPLLKRGEYLVMTLGCNDCHSPKKMGPRGPEIIAETALSGYQANDAIPGIDKTVLQNWVLFNGSNTMTVGPWGASFAGNITSDPTGIGGWTYAQFKIALTQGFSKGIKTNRMLLPPMPWTNYVKMTDADLKAIFAYLKSTKPVNNLVPAPITPDKF
jgi:mono/diheme cytochrome c family protein